MLNRLSVLQGQCQRPSVGIMAIVFLIIPLVNSVTCIVKTHCSLLPGLHVFYLTYNFVQVNTLSKVSLTNWIGKDINRS